jgi:predicted dehydrogenase
MAVTLEEIDEMIALAESRRLTLGVFYEMRYARGFAIARDLVQGGALGRIFGVKLQTLIDKKLSYWQVGYMGRAANPWRCEKGKAGGGVTLMNTSHILDGLWYVTGLGVTRVSAEYGSLVANVEVEDTLSATLRFDSGAIGSLYSAAHSIGAKGDETIEIYGTLGTVRVPDPYGTNPVQVFLREPWGDIPANEWHILSVEPPGVIHDAVGFPTHVFLDALNGFMEAVRNHKPAPIDGYAARRVLEIVLAMYRAADEQCTVELGKKELLYAES